MTSLNIAVVGVTGKIGSRIAAEAVSRGHQVTGISRSTTSGQVHQAVERVAASIHDRAALAALFRDRDVVVHAYRPGLDDPDRIGQQRLGTQSLIGACQDAGVRRVMAVGGAGSLMVDGVRFMEHPSFPPEWQTGGIATYLVKEMLEVQPSLDWTFICPPHMIVPGERTGRYRTSLDELLFDSEGKSWISIEDYAVAFVDEMENPRHMRRRFAVGY